MTETCETTSARHLAATGPPPGAPYYHRVRAVQDIVIALHKKSGVSPTEFRVLDVGCGKGELVSGLLKRGFDVAGSDVSPELVELSSRYCPCVSASVYDLLEHFERGAFDVVLCSHVLEHLTDPITAVSVMRSLTRKWLVLAVPNPLHSTNLIGAFLRSRVVKEGHVYSWDRRHFENFLKSYCGLNVHHIETDYIDVLPRPIWLRRLLSPILTVVECRVLPGVFPYFSRSIIAVCDTASDE